MTPASGPTESAGNGRMIHARAADALVAHRSVSDLPRVLAPGNVLVVNDAATLPAAITFDHDHGQIELRLLRQSNLEEVEAVLLGNGDRTMRTEDRADPPVLRAGTLLTKGDLAVRIVSLDPRSPRRARVRIEGGPVGAWRSLYDQGEVIQYSYVAEALELWDVQTVYAGRPWASEMPSAGRPLSFAMLTELRRRGIAVTRVTHGAGPSSTGDATLDRELPFPEHYRIDDDAAHTIAAAQDEGRRIVAVGTTVVRALESAARTAGGRITAMEAETDLHIDESTELLVCDAILTGMHDPGTSHFDLLTAFVPRTFLDRATKAAEDAGYLAHEFGDSMFVE